MGASHVKISVAYDSSGHFEPKHRIVNKPTLKRRESRMIEAISPGAMRDVTLEPGVISTFQ